MPPDGPAGRAGLHPGDVIVKVNDPPTATADDLLAAIRAPNPVDTVTLRLSTGHTVAVVLGSYAVPPIK